MCNTIVFFAVIYDRSLFTLVMYKVSFLPAHQQSSFNSQQFLRKFLINNSLCVVLKYNSFYSMLKKL
jgi:hypothetical protein